MDINGQAINEAESDALFRECLRRRSVFSFYSPLSWWRWASVRLWRRLW